MLTSCFTSKYFSTFSFKYISCADLTEYHKSFLISDKSGLSSNDIDIIFLAISITGQTTTKFELDYKNLVVGESLNQFFKICNWIYEKDGDTVDKIEIARNII